MSLVATVSIIMVTRRNEKKKMKKIKVWIKLCYRGESAGPWRTLHGEHNKTTTAGEQATKETSHNIDWEKTTCRSWIERWGGGKDLVTLYNVDLGAQLIKSICLFVCV